MTKDLVDRLVCFGRGDRLEAELYLDASLTDLDSPQLPERGIGERVALDLGELASLAERALLRPAALEVLRSAAGDVFVSFGDGFQPIHQYEIAQRRTIAERALECLAGEGDGNPLGS